MGGAGGGGESYGLSGGAVLGRGGVRLGDGHAPRQESGGDGRDDGDRESAHPPAAPKKRLGRQPCSRCPDDLKLRQHDDP